MKLNGLDVEIIRGETGAISFELIDKDGRPFVMATEGMFDGLRIAFKVKRNPHTVNEKDYIINKELSLDSVKRFAQVDIINIREYINGLGGVFSEYSWSGCSLSGGRQFPTNRLFYHPVLNEYRYSYWIEFDLNDDSNLAGPNWLTYKFEIVVPFTTEDTVALAYSDYYYDLVLEGYDNDILEYSNILIPQHKFTVTYRV